MSKTEATQARKEIANDFATAFAADFREHGAETITRLREKDPAAYLRLAAAIEPAGEETNPMCELSDEDLSTFLEALRETIKERTRHSL